MLWMMKQNDVPWVSNLSQICWV